MPGPGLIDGCRLSPLAANQRLRPWPELKKAGLEGGMDELRARAFLDLVLGKDSRPRQDGAEPGGPACRRVAGQVTLTSRW